MAWHPVEIQVRTTAMHRDAEEGSAAHWLYKVEEEGRTFETAPLPSRPLQPRDGFVTELEGDLDTNRLRV